MKIWCAVTAAALSLAACSGEETTPAPTTAAATEAKTFALTGQLLDWQKNPVANAEVKVAVGSFVVSSSVMTDANGFYTLAGIPLADVEQALETGAEINLLFESPLDDRGAKGIEDDYVHLLPVTLVEFIDLASLKADATVEVKTAHVPLQPKGYNLAEVMENGGELTWTVNDTQYGEEMTVTIMIEPGSIQFDGDPTQQEIALSVLDADKAPMSIPEGGYGPIWTLQPREMVFDPPARIRVTGDRLPLVGMAALDVGDSSELFGASLETGWDRFGDVEVIEMDGGRITLESKEGIIRRGAWGHVFNNSLADSGALVTCKDATSGEPTPCIVFDSNLPGECVSDVDGTDFGTGSTACYQVDYNLKNLWAYSTMHEDRCGNCGSHPNSQLAIGLNHCTEIDAAGNCLNFVENRNHYFHGVALCPEEIALGSYQEQSDAVYQRFLNDADFGAALLAHLGEALDGNPDLDYVFSTDDLIAAIEAGVLFPGDVALPPAAVGAESFLENLQRRQFNKAVTLFVPTPTNCAAP